MTHFIIELAGLKEQEAIEKLKSRAENLFKNENHYFGIPKQRGKILYYGNGTSENGKEELWVIGDVTIYNRNFLTGKLSIKIGRKEQYSDHRLLVKSYERWGIECLQYIIGDFSFVIWDELNQCLFAARDHIGVKQLYYRNNPGEPVSISSSARLIMNGQITRSDRINTQYLTDYLLGLQSNRALTVFNSILQLPPAHFLTINGTKLKIQRYWSPKISYFPRLFKKKNLKKRFLRLFSTVLTDRWPDDGKVGLLLSGGLDSTSILCMLRHRLELDKEKINLFSKVSADPKKNEGDTDARFIEIALAYTDMQTNYSVEPKTPIGVVDLYRYYESQFRLPWSPFIVNINPLEQLYKETGVTDIFSGFGGDEIVSIDPRCKELYLFFIGRFLLLHRIFEIDQGESGTPVLKNIFRKIIFPLFPRRMQLAYKKLRGNTSFDVIENSFICQEFSDYLQLIKYVGKKRGRDNNRGYFDPRKEIKNAVLSGYFIPFLEHCTAISERSACKLHMPLIDKRLIEFCLSVPAMEYVKDGVPRSFLKNCMRDILPEEVRTRESKTLFGETDDIQMIANKKLFDTILDAESSLAWQIIDRDLLRRTYNVLLTGNIKAQHRILLGHQLSKGINVAAFCQWFEAKKESSPELSD